MRSITPLILFLSMTLLMPTPVMANFHNTPPFASAANPCGEDTPQARHELDTYLQLAVEHFKSKPYAEVFAPDKQGKPLEEATLHPLTSEQPIKMAYNAIAPTTPDVVPVILVNFGTAMNTLNMSGILWLKKGEWYVQPYPQAVLPEIVKQRRTVLQDHFCHGVLLQARQQGEYLAVINDLGAGGTKSVPKSHRVKGDKDGQFIVPAQEVHLLKRAKAGHWIVVWVPLYNNWRDVYMSQIQFGNDNLRTFTINRTDSLDLHKKWKETWQLQGYEYKQVSREDIP